MVRKFNYTNRRKIPRENIRVSIKTLNGKYYFDASLDHEKMNFPSYTKVYIEPYYGPNYLRFYFGTFAEFNQPNDTDITRLRTIADKIFFRIKLVDESEGQGLLLGFADNITLSEATESKLKTSILYANKVEIDTGEIWRLNFDNSSGPLLEINSSILGIGDFAKDSIFLSLVYPSAIRQILNKIEDIGIYEKYGDDWTNKWIRFAENTLNVHKTPENNNDDELVSIWKDDVVRAFCNRFKTFDQFNKLIESWGYH